MAYHGITWIVTFILEQNKNLYLHFSRIFYFFKFIILIIAVIYSKKMSLNYCTMS